MEDMDIELDDDKIIKISNFVEYEDGSATFTIDASPKMMTKIVEAGMIAILKDHSNEQEIQVDGID